MFIYAAACYCDECGIAIQKDVLKALNKTPEDFADERTFDSDEYPKGPYSDEQEADGPEHCASGEDCLNPTIIGDQVCGYFFGNELTTHGVENLQEMHRNSPSEITEFWVNYYNSHGYDIDTSVDYEQAIAGMSKEDLRNCLSNLCDTATEKDANIEHILQCLKEWGLK